MSYYPLLSLAAGSGGGEENALQATRPVVAMPRSDVPSCRLRRCRNSEESDQDAALRRYRSWLRGEWRRAPFTKSSDGRLGEIDRGVAA